MKDNTASEPNEGLDPSGALYDAGFSFLRIDRELNCATLDLSEPNGSRRLYKVQFACCPDPTCDCGVLNLILNPLRESHSSTNPDCSCTEVFLDFASHGDKTLPPAWNVRQKDVTTIRFSYQDGTIEVSRKGSAGSPTATALMDSFKAACPEFKSRFKRRHTVLRASHNTAIAPHEPDVPPPALRSVKIGRNERCPCGSDKNYKFCCGL